MQPFLIWMLIIWSNGMLVAQQFPFVHYTPKDGLINSRVRSIRQDSKGRMYFMTYGGLSVYDGVAFQNYNRQSGLANEFVNDLIELSPDSFLIATNIGKLNTLVRGKIGKSQSAANLSPVINRFHKSPDGHLYAVADEGLFKLAGHEFQRTPLRDDQGNDLGLNLDRITEWKNYLFLQPWNAQQKENVIIYDKEKQRVIGTIQTKFIHSLAVTSHDELWLSSADGIEKMDLAALRKNEIRLSPVLVPLDGRQYKNFKIYSDPNHGIWLYQSNKVIHLPGSGRKQVMSIEQGLNTSNLYSLLVDREGILWMATDGDGVIKLPGTQFQLIDNLVPGQKNDVRVLYQQADTTWLFNRPDNAFYQIHDKQVKRYPLGQDKVSVANMYILGRTLYYMANQNIFSIEDKDVISSYTHPVLFLPDDEPVLETGATLVDPHSAIIQYVRGNDTLFYLRVILNNRTVFKQKLHAALDQLALDSRGDLWVATRGDRLHVYSRHPETPADYLQLRYDYSGAIGEIGPRALTVDTEGYVWIGTRHNGIYRFHFETGKLKTSNHFSTADGLTDNFYYYLYCDPGNNIWAGSQTGLDKISLKNGTYSIENVTKTRNIFQGVYRVINAEKDVIWALTSNGDIIEIAMAPPGPTAPPPSCYISSLVVNDSSFDVRATRFAHDQNNFSIRIAAPSFTDEKSIHYSYQLKGSGQMAWSEPSNNALFQFINLAPGRYELNVKAAFPAAQYPAQYVTYSFAITPPYWMTWWFRLLSGFIIIGLLAFAVRYYYLKKLEKQRIMLESRRAMEKERTRIATDMHDDLGAGLTRIKFLSEMMEIKQQQQLPVYEETSSIRSHAHAMIDKMGELVWALNEKNDSLNDLIGYTRAYSVAYLSENGISSEVDAPDELPVIAVAGEFRRNIYLSVKEALHNIIKHARATTVHMQYDISDQLRITIRDDGIGFDPTVSRPWSNGLVNMKNRMEMIGGNMEIRNGDGTTVIFTAPLPT